MLTQPSQPKRNFLSLNQEVKMKRFFTILSLLLVLGLITFLIGNQKILQTQKIDIKVTSLQVELSKMKKDIKLLEAEIAKYKECISISPKLVTINRDHIRLKTGRKGSISLDTSDGNLYLGGERSSKVLIKGRLEISNELKVSYRNPVTFTGQVFFKKRAHFQDQVFFDVRPFHRYENK